MRRLGWLTVCAALAVGCDSTDAAEDSVLPGVQSMVFVKRSYQGEDGTHNVTSGMGQVFDYQRYNPGEGAGLYTLTPPTPDGKLRNLTESFEGVDINGIDLSFDAKEVVFSMRTADDRYYHIFLATLDNGEVRQLTFHEAHDTQPVFVPGGRIVFVTNQPFTEMGTRADEYNHSRVVTQLATISEAGGDADRVLCSQNLSHHASPFMLSNGLVGFSRWEHLGPVNDVKLFTMRPDCTQMRALAGQHGKPSNSIVQVKEVDHGQFIAVATSRDETIQSGALMRISVPSDTSGTLFNEQAAAFENITEGVPLGDESPPSGVGRFRAPAPLPNTSNLVVSWADGDVNSRNELVGTAPDFGLYMWDAASGRRTLVYNDPDMWDLYALPVAVRDEPPALAAVNVGDLDLNTPATIGSLDVTQTSLGDMVRGAQFAEATELGDALKQAQRVRVIEGFSSEIGSVGQFGLTMHEGGAILGEAQVHADGSWRADIPPYLPVHLQPLDRFDLAIRNQMLWIQAMPGEANVCGGCHESRAMEQSSAPTIAQQVGATDMVNAIADRVELPWYNATSGSQVQDVFDAKCVSCHSGGDNDPFAGQTYSVEVTTEDGEMLAYEIPFLDLSSRPLQAYYEMEVVAYPASYVTLLYPSAMMGEVRVEGAPDEWVRPGDARGSRLIEKININAVDYNNDGQLVETQEWAYAGAAHPEDVGVTLTRAERVTLIRSIDLGGQYYSRRNVDGTNWGAAADTAGDTTIEE